MKKETNVVNKMKCPPGGFLSGVSRLFVRLVNKETTLLYQQRISGRSRIKCGMTPSFYNSGFTLIELLVVVLIIGILAAVALPQYQKAVDKARYTQARNLLENVWQAEQRYKLATGSYTMRFDDLDIEMPTSTDIHHDSDADIYNYQWGSCWLHNTGYIACKVKLGSSASAWYFARTHSTNRECWAAPGTSTRADALCKAVTQKSTGSDSSTYKIYQF